MKKAEIDSRLLDLKARQDAGEKMPCPRCGRNTIKSPLAHNALSRYADLYVCDECGMTEAMLDMMRNPLPLDQWAIFRNTGPEFDFKALSMQEVVGRVLGGHTDELLRQHSAWIHRTEGRVFEIYREQALKAGHCAHCGQALNTQAHPQTKRFCSALCRTSWWGKHPDQRRKQGTARLCSHCDRQFFSYSTQRRYCSHPCYIASRFGKGAQFT